MRRALVIGVLLLAVAAPSAARQPTATVDWQARSALDDTALIPTPKRPWRAAAEVVGVNALVWSFNRFIREGGENPVFRIGFDSWSENLQAGFEWDDNSFTTNQFAHPYHGSLYFNAARSSGYDFWESVPFAFGGSFLWEYFFEVHHPSMNDWIATSVGGSALGEMLHRLSTSVRDNEATGAERTWREIGGFAINPVGGLNRAFDGDMGRRHANPPDRHPRVYRARMDVGARTVADERLFAADTTRAFMEFEFDYGDPFAGDRERPYDSFDMLLQLNFDDRSLIARLESNGLLAGTLLKETPAASHLLGAHLHHDFINTNQIELGAQALSAGLNSRYDAGEGSILTTELNAGPVLLGAVSSDYESISGRSYDYGPGAIVMFSASFGRPGWQYLYASHQQFWVHAISGNRADHYVSLTRLRLAVPVWNDTGLGFEYHLILAEGTYKDYPDVSHRRPQLRVFAKFVLD